MNIISEVDNAIAQRVQTQQRMRGQIQVSTLPSKSFEKKCFINLPISFSHYFLPNEPCISQDDPFAEPSAPPSASRYLSNVNHV